MQRIITEHPRNNSLSLPLDSQSGRVKGYFMHAVEKVLQEGVLPQWKESEEFLYLKKLDSETIKRLLSVQYKLEYYARLASILMPIQSEQRINSERKSEWQVGVEVSIISSRRSANASKYALEIPEYSIISSDIRKILNYHYWEGTWEFLATWIGFDASIQHMRQRAQNEYYESIVAEYLSEKEGFESIFFASIDS
jgi:hypothetical protein